MAESAMARLAVDEYRGNQIIEWDSISQCAKAHHFAITTLRYLIHTGGALDGFSPFDIPIHSHYDTRRTGETMRDVEIYDTRTGRPIEPNPVVIHRPLRVWLGQEPTLCDDDTQEKTACQG